MPLEMMLALHLEQSIGASDCALLLEVMALEMMLALPSASASPPLARMLVACLEGKSDYALPPMVKLLGMMLELSTAEL